MALKVKEYYEREFLEPINSELEKAVKLALLSKINDADLDLHIAFPHEVYFVGLTDIVEDKLLSAATLGCLRYLLFDGEDRPFGCIDLRFEGDDPVPKFSNVSFGYMAAVVVSALLSAESKASELELDYEVRSLEASGICFAALWMHFDEEGDKDLIIPLSFGGSPEETFLPRSEAELIGNLKEMALVSLKGYYRRRK